MFQSNSKYFVKETIASTDTVGDTFKISTDFELGLDLETGSEIVSFILKNGTQIERFEITATGWVATIVLRGLSQSATATANVLLQKQWTDGTIAYVAALAYDILDKQGDTMTGALRFSGTTHQGIAPISLTTVQRLALSLASWDTAVVRDTTLGGYYIWDGGAWYPLASGSTQPNASATVAGKIEIATTAESKAGTNVGGTGAFVSVLPSDIAANEQSGTFVTATDVGGDDTYVWVFTPAIDAYTIGQEVTIIVTTPNTWACTADLGPGPKNIKDIYGNDPITGDVNGMVRLKYDGTNLVLLNTTSSSTDRKGVIKTSTNATTITGTATDEAVTPATLAATKSGCVAKNAGAVTLTTSPVLFPFNAEDFDTDTYHDTVTNNSRLTVPTTGKYELAFNGELASSTTGDYYAYISLKKNGTILFTRTTSVYTAGGGGFATIGFSYFVSAAATDYFEIEISKSSATPTMAFDGGGNAAGSTYFMIKKF